MKNQLLTSAFILALSATVLAQDLPANKESRGDAISPAITAIQTAAQLSQYGYANEDPLSLVQAAKMVVAYPPRAIETAAETTGNTRGSAAGKSTAAAVIDAATLLNDAEAMANDEHTLAIIAKAKQDLNAPSRGAVSGPQTLERYVDAEDITIDVIVMKGNELAEVLVYGDGDNDLDLFVFDENQNVVASDDDYTDKCYVSFTPSKTARYAIVVKNWGESVYSNYILMTN